MASIYALGFLYLRKCRASVQLPYNSFIKLYLLAVTVNCLRGVLIAENYWEYKALIEHTGAVLIPLLLWPLSCPKLLGKTLKLWMALALPIFAIYFFILIPRGYGFYLSPLAIFLVLFVHLRASQKILILLFAGIVIIHGVDGRAMALRFIFPLFFVGLFLLKRYSITYSAIKIGALTCFVLPFILLGLAANGTFNIFKMQNYVRQGSTISPEQFKEATADTRTFIYDEIWQSATRNNYVWTGRGLARGYDSKSFGMHQLKELGTGKLERFRSEVGILNIFNWMGLTGAFLYSALFLIATYLSIFKSASFSLKVLGLYVSFRWAFSWIQEFTEFEITFFALWMLVAICWSPQFRAMSDSEIRDWLRSIVPDFLRIRDPRMIR